MHPPTNPGFWLVLGVLALVLAYAFPRHASALGTQATICFAGAAILAK